MQEFDLASLEDRLRFLYNATEVDIDSEGIFATFFYDPLHKTRYNFIKSMFTMCGLKDVEMEINVEDSEVLIYGFYNSLNDEPMHEIVLVSDDDSIEILDERKTVIKVNAKGKRRRKVVCGKGKKWDGSRCVVMSGKQKLNIKKGKIKARRSQRARSGGSKKRTQRLKAKALKRRMQQGLGNK